MFTSAANCTNRTALASVLPSCCVSSRQFFRSRLSGESTRGCSTRNSPHRQWHEYHAGSHKYRTHSLPQSKCTVQIQMPFQPFLGQFYAPLMHSFTFSVCHVWWYHLHFVTGHVCLFAVTCQRFLFHVEYAHIVSWVNARNMTRANTHAVNISYHSSQKDEAPMATVPTDGSRPLILRG